MGGMEEREENWRETVDFMQKRKMYSQQVKAGSQQMKGREEAHMPLSPPLQMDSTT
jgi:hypothetical protein